MDRYQPIQEGEDWIIRDTEARQNLLGYYTEQGAITTAARLNANISLSPNQMRALNTLLSVQKLSAHKLYEQFKNRIYGSDMTIDGLKIARQLEEHGLVTIDNETIIATDWAYTWAGRKRPE